MQTGDITFQTSALRAALRCVAFVLVTLVLFIPALVLWALALEKIRGRLVQWFFIILGWVSGIRITREGVIATERPLMLVANHSSYLDIFVLGSLAPLSFTPKKEIRSWPIIGQLCVLADCIFIERRAGDMQRVQAEMAARLGTGKIIGLFPEGTTGDGFHVKAFKSGFLSLVEDHNLPVQPVSIAYTHVGEVALSAATRDQVAWIGEATLVDHLWRLLKFPYVKVGVTFYPIERIANYDDRKALAKACEHTIREGLTKSLEAAGVIS